MSKSTPRDVVCPSCSKSVPASFLNSHLDSCLNAKPASVSQTKAIPASKPAGTSNKRSLASTSSSSAKIPSKRFKSSQALQNAKPLAERCRPTSLDDYVGQEHILGKGAVLRNLIEQDQLGSLCLWGPPGTGKTTLARIIAQTTNSSFQELSATSAGKADIQKIFDNAANQLKLTGKKTVLFIDEVQRFNKTQQDLFLPYIEAGLISCLLATTENPSFRLQTALLSRCRVFTLNKLSADNCAQILRRALSTQDIVPSNINEDLINFLAAAADGDGRVALSSLELALNAANADPNITTAKLKETLLRAHMNYDRAGEQHYDTISALHKAVRGSDAEAALYWLARMLEGGEDPLYVARRVVRMATEDIGSADPTALPLCLAAYQSCQLIGMPECDCILAQAVVHLAEAPKSIRVYAGYNKAKALVRKAEAYPVPLHIRNAPTKLMKDLGYGKEYLYNPGFAHPVHQTYLPPELEGKTNFLIPDKSIHDKTVNLEALAEYEAVNGPWPGREALERGAAEV